jgi:hypothetical protein
VGRIACSHGLENSIGLITGNYAYAIRASAIQLLLQCARSRGTQRAGTFVTVLGKYLIHLDLSFIQPAPD